MQDFCSGQPNEDETRACYESASAIIGRFSMGAKESAATACSYFPNKYKRICFVTTAQAVIEEDRANVKGALALCTSAGSESKQCLQEIAARASFFYPRGSREFAQFCEQFPSEVQSQCL